MDEHAVKMVWCQPQLSDVFIPLILFFPVTAMMILNIRTDRTDLMLPVF